MKTLTAYSAIAVAVGLLAFVLGSPLTRPQVQATRTA